MGAVGGKHGAQLPNRANLAAWYRYRQGVVNISGKCSQWNDASNQNRPLLQGTADSQPTVMSDGSLQFDGVDDFMKATFTLVQPCTIYLAVRQISWVSGDVILDGATGATKLIQTGSTPELVVDAGSALAGNAALGVGPWGCVAVIFFNAGGGSQIAGGGPPVIVSGATGSNDPGGITIGAAQAPANYANIGVREIVVYSDTHNVNTRIPILRYLGRVASVGGI